MKYTIHLTPCDIEGEKAVEWTVDNEAGCLMGAGYCKDEADARNDAQVFIREVLEQEWI